MNKIRIGTRGSKLALKQASLVQEALLQAESGIESEIVVIHTKGDRIQDKPLNEIGDKGVFASELEMALQDGKIDLAVHSAKDLPMMLAEGLVISAVLPRADVRDVLVIPKGGRMPLLGGCRAEDGKLSEESMKRTSKNQLCAPDRKFVIGTGSRRRQQQAGQIWANVVCENIRGNVDTRLRKLKGRGSEGTDSTMYDGIILAKAGLDRLEIMSQYEEDFAFHPLSPEKFLPAACQGIIAVEAVQDSDAAAVCRRITDAETEFCFLVEREVLAGLSADCSEAAAAWCRREKNGWCRNAVSGENETCQDAVCGPDELILDAMYAGNRKRLVWTVDTSFEDESAKKEERLREGLRMARQAAGIVKYESLMIEERTGRVYLTGGGCGDAGLLTLKAWEVLKSCDVVVYDSLVSEELLKWCRPDCERIYVGKRYGSHAMKQPDINAVLVEKAREGKTVVRLKGGDPYVFGRGGEEFLAVQEAGIYCEEIPGISSAVAVPAAAGIPVTHRGLAAGVTIVTGTAAEEDRQARLRLDFDTLARLDGTLVILMGMHHLEEIAEGLLAAGKNPDTPCAVIMEGTTGRQRCVRAVLSRLYEETAGQGLTSPAVIVIGAVAKLELLCSGEDSHGQDVGTRESGIGEKSEQSKTDTSGSVLSGVSIGATGTPHFVKKLSAVLAEKGADVWDMGFMEIRPGENPLPDLEDCGWLVFTSPNGVKVFWDKMKRERKDLRGLCGKRIAVIGPGTEAVLEEVGIYADYIPEIYDAMHLAEGLTERILAEQREGNRNKIPAVFLRAEQGSESLPRIFAEKGISFLEYPIYKLAVQEEKRAISAAKKPDYIVFGSAMGVRAYFEGLEQTGLTNEKSRFVCIGELCGEELKKHTERRFLTARESSVDGIVECICAYASSWNGQSR